MSRLSQFLFFVFTSVLPLSAQSAGEFHHGYGGFSLDTKLALSSQQQANFSLGEYHLYGEILGWKGDGHDISITVCSVIKPSSSTNLTPLDKTAIIDRWKGEFKKQAAEQKISFGEKPYIFGGSKGIEFTAAGGRNFLSRAFMIGTRIYILAVYASSPAELSRLAQIVDSFRKLTDSERTIAMIEQFSPPALPQEKPERISAPDTVEMGLREKVSRVQEVYQKSASAPKLAHREMVFDPQGFLLRDISFLEGFPDVITAWGWVDGKRVNNQSGVNYPDREGPQQSRQIVLSGGVGTFPSLLPGRPESRIYGNLVETKQLDDAIVERRRFSASGMLVLVDTIRRSGQNRDVKTTDSSGGFIGWFRERLDDAGNVIQTETLSSDGKPYRAESYEYEFDQRKNWIVKRVIAHIGKTKKPAGFYTRTITYNDVPDRNIAKR